MTFSPQTVTSPSAHAVGTPPDEPGGGVIGRSPGQLMWRRFRRDRTGVVSAVVVPFFILVAVAAPLISAVYGRTTLRT